MAMLESSKRAGAASRSDGARWPGAAFILEALLLLLFLAACLAVLMQLFGYGARQGTQNARLEQAIVVAGNAAERFAADPASFADSYAVTDNGDLVVRCDVTAQETAGGTLYQGDIVVYSDGDELYRLSSARYVSDAGESEVS